VVIFPQQILKEKRRASRLMKSRDTPMRETRFMPRREY